MENYIRRYIKDGDLKKLEIPMYDYIGNVIQSRDKNVIQSIFSHVIVDLIPKIKPDKNLLSYLYKGVKSEYLRLQREDQIVKPILKDKKYSPVYRVSLDDVPEF